MYFVALRIIKHWMILEADDGRQMYPDRHDAETALEAFKAAHPYGFIEMRIGEVETGAVHGKTK